MVRPLLPLACTRASKAVTAHACIVAFARSVSIFPHGALGGPARGEEPPSAPRGRISRGWQAAMMEEIMHQFEDKKNTFRLGQVVSTPGALEQIPTPELWQALSRHSKGDWGECCADDWKENELSLKEGFRILSVYRTVGGTKFWIITEADRSVTTVLLPEEY